MQFPTIVSIIALVCLTNALPAANGGGSGGASCPSSSTQYCCDTTSLLGILGLSCTLSNILGTGCSSQTICCVNSVCTQTDGTDITVPITIL